MVALKCNELSITVTLRSIRELFQVRDVYDYATSFPYMQPDLNLSQFEMYPFLQTSPEDLSVGLPNAYENKRDTWNADVHMISTCCFLSPEEAKRFAMEDQIYLVKDAFTYNNFQNITGTQKVSLTSSGMVAAA